MAEPEHAPVLDLEDGEIESDEEAAPPAVENLVVEVKKEAEVPQKKEKEKKKKSKSHKKLEKPPMIKPKRKRPSPVEDDFAGKVEQAIRKQMKHDEGVQGDQIIQVIEDEEDIGSEGPEERRKIKKRKKQDGSCSKKKRRRKHDMEELNDDELMFTRGASPPPHRSPSPYDCRSEESYDSAGSHDGHRPHHNRHPPQRNRPPQHLRERKNMKRERRRDNMHPMQDQDGVCIYFMQGKCHKGDDCSFSHDAQPPRKMELCKFYLMDCCAKRDKCLYLHGDFPCKYYHTGLQCKSDCKFSHGGPLSESFRAILLKHIESAPKEILGDFPRLSRENAMMMISATQMKLVQQYGAPEGNESCIPSLFDMNCPKPHDIEHQYNQYNEKHSTRNAHKNRQSRWQTSTVDIPNNFSNMQNNINNMGNNFNNIHTVVNNMPNILGNPMINQDVLSIRNLTGVLTPHQISDLTNLGIDNLNQLSQLTVIQLNQLGLNLKQINEIQLNTLSIQKLGLIEGGDTSLSNLPTPVTSTKDLDMRIAPVIPEVVGSSVPPADSLGQDVDMRFQSPPTTSSTVTGTHNVNTTSSETKPSDRRAGDPRKNKQKANKDQTIDIDQYTKDALKFASKERENIDMSDDYHDNGDLSIDDQMAGDMDHRTLQNEKEHGVTIANNDTDTDSRFLHPDNFTKKPEKRHRRSTTDDEDSNLLIDEKWYSSDEEKSSKIKSPHYSPRGPCTPPKYSPQRSPRRPTTPPEPASVLDRLGDLSKIQVSDEVTRLLATMKNNLKGSQSPKPEVSKLRDPRSLPKKSPEHKSSSTDLVKMMTHKKPKISIYECVEGATSDRRRRSDVDLRQLDPDFMLPPLGDTDLRADVDFRLGMPFKPLPNYTPATEIDGAINSHPPMPYKLRAVDIPRPDYSDIKDGTAKSQAMADPRLRKLFRLSVEDSSSDGEKSSRPAAAPRSDPRRKPSPAEPDLKPASVDIQNVTNNSSWYKELSTNQKIFVNQQLATVNSMLKKYQQLEKPLGRRFDISQVQGNPIIFSIFNNLGVSVDEAGEIAYSKCQEGLISSPLYMGPEYGQMMEGVSMMSAPPTVGIPMGPMNPMTGFNAPFPNPANLPAPGLLGYAPNMPAPPGFGLSTYGGQGSDGFHGNMAMNSGGDFGNMDDDGYNSNIGRGNYRGRGGERWRGGGGGPQRGNNRDRRKYDRGGGGGWK